MIIYTTASTKEELDQILELQRRNLPNSISSEEKQVEGFVTLNHDFDILKRMNDVCPHIIAKDGNTLAGYALCMHPKFANEIVLLRPMFEEISRALQQAQSDIFFSEKFIVMGQICIAKDFRKRGVFRKLYETMLAKLTPKFTSIITEVDAANTRSVQAHLAIGFKSLSTYKADGRDWELIYLE